MPVASSALCAAASRCASRTAPKSSCGFRREIMAQAPTLGWCATGIRRIAASRVATLSHPVVTVGALDPSGSVAGDVITVGAAVSAQPVGWPGLGATLARKPPATPSSATVGEPPSGTDVAPGLAAGAGSDEALMACLSSVPGVGAASARVPLATRFPDPLGTATGASREMRAACSARSVWSPRLGASMVRLLLVACLSSVPGVGAASARVPLATRFPDPLGTATGASRETRAACSARSVWSPRLGASMVRLLLVAPSPATVGESPSGTNVAPGSAAGAGNDVALMACLSGVPGVGAAMAHAPLATRSSVPAVEPASGTRVASGSPAGTGIDMALVAQCCGMPGVGAVRALAAVSHAPLATCVAAAFGVFDPLGTAAGSGRNAALPICFLRVLGTAEATPRV